MVAPPSSTDGGAPVGAAVHPGPATSPDPRLFFVLILPYGAAYGLVAVALQYLATAVYGIHPSDWNDVIASVFIPHSLKVFWAPVVDITLTRKTWYVISLVLVAAGVVVLSAMTPLRPEKLHFIMVVAMVSQLGTTLMGMTCEAMIGLTVADDQKGRASGWYQAGAYAGLGVGGWGALKLFGILHAGWMVGAALGLAMSVCVLPLLVLPEPASTGQRGSLGQAMKDLLRDILGLVRRWRVGLTAMIIAVSPVGASSITNLLNSLPGRWGITGGHPVHILAWTLGPEEIVGLFNGLGGNLISAAGCLVGGLLADRMNRRLAYALAGALMAATSLAMAASPSAPWAYLLYGSLYNFFMGISFAAFTGFVLETVGKGAVATKSNIFASLGNVAIGYMTKVDGEGLRRWGVTGMLLTDAVLVGAGIVLLLAMTLLARLTDPARATPT